MVSFLHRWSPLRKLGASALLAVVLSLLCFGILWLEYGVLNFGDSDLPPYQPNTLFEDVVDTVWYTVTLGAGLMWLFAVVYVILLLGKYINRKLA